jgi:hypothetical protein
MKRFFSLNLDLTRVQGCPQVHRSGGYIQRNLACYINKTSYGEESEWGGEEARGGWGVGSGLRTPTNAVLLHEATINPRTARRASLARPLLTASSKGVAPAASRAAGSAPAATMAAHTSR